MLNIRTLKRCFDTNADDDSLAFLLRSFGFDDECAEAFLDIERMCCRRAVKITRRISCQADDSVGLEVRFHVREGFEPVLSVRISFDEYISNEAGVSVCGACRYQGVNLSAAAAELKALIEGGLESRIGHKDASDYRCGLFKVRYLSSFKRLLEDKSVRKDGVEAFLKGIRCTGTFVTDAFVRALYESDGGKCFSIDLFDDGSAHLKAEEGGREKEFKCLDIASCIHKAYDLLCTRV